MFFLALPFVQANVFLILVVILTATTFNVFGSLFQKPMLPLELIDLLTKLRDPGFLTGNICIGGQKRHARLEKDLSRGRLFLQGQQDVAGEIPKELGLPLK